MIQIRVFPPFNRRANREPIRFSAGPRSCLGQSQPPNPGQAGDCVTGASAVHCSRTEVTFFKAGADFLISDFRFNDLYPTGKLLFVALS